MIPQRTIQLARSRHLLTRQEALNRSRLIEQLPAWEHRFFSFAEARSFVAETRGDLLEFYDFLPRASQKAHLFRAVVLHELGGWWIDLALHPFSSAALADPKMVPPAASAVLVSEGWLDPETFFDRHGLYPPSPDRSFWISSALMGSAKGTPLWQRLLDMMIVRSPSLDYDESSEQWLEFVTGAGVLNAAIQAGWEAERSSFHLIRAALPAGAGGTVGGSSRCLPMTCIGHNFFIGTSTASCPESHVFDLSKAKMVGPPPLHP